MQNDKIPGIKAYYDAAAEQWADKWYEEGLMLPLLKQFMGILPESPRILDAGCGAGYESKRLHGLGAEVVGVDFSEVSIKIARERTPECRFEVMDCRELDADVLGAFDGIISIALLVHMQTPELPAVFAGFRRVIKPGGYLFIAFVEGDGYGDKQSLLEVDGVQYNRAFYRHPEERMDAMAAQAGFVHYDEWYQEGEPEGRWQFHVYRAE